MESGMHQSAPTRYVITLILVSAFSACSGEKTNTLSAKQVSSAEASQSASAKQVGTPEVSQPATTGCDASLWDHVYSPKRLQQLVPCLSVTGTIDESSVDEDGDQHFLLKLDPGQDTLVNKRNAKKKGGDIVLEIVCANPTTMKKPKSACAGYTNPVPIPAVGAHVRATGTYVIDTHNGWAEIHPVSKLEKR
jgi:hypothetical protein